MTDTRMLPSVTELKTQARRLRDSLRASGVDLSHSAALEQIAHQHGARDWNTLHALAGNQLTLRIGERVKGRYLGQPFTGEVRGLAVRGDGSHQRVTLHFDEPVDVVTFDSFSAYRQRVSADIGPDGTSPQRISTGEPQLVVMPA